MKIETNKQDLEAVLGLVGVAGESGKSDNIRTHFCFKSDGNTVEILATDERLSARGPLVSNVSGEGAFTVEAWRLTKWLKAIPEGVVNLSFTKSSVVVSGSNSRIVLQSLDPADFPAIPSPSEEEAPMLEAKRAHTLISYLRSFILEDENQFPQYNITELKNGAFWATNQKALVIMTVPELATTNLRIHNLDISTVLAFLAACGTHPVRFVEQFTGKHQGFFIVHPGGSSLFVPRGRKEFPDLSPHLTILQSEGSAWWEVSPAELNAAIHALTASADNDNKVVCLAAQGSDALEVSIRSAFGGEDSTARVSAKIRLKQASKLPPGKYAFNHPSLVATLAKIKDPIAALEMFLPEPEDTPKRSRTAGMARLVVKTKDGDEIHTILHWSVVP